MRLFCRKVPKLNVHFWDAFNLATLGRTMQQSTSFPTLGNCDLVEKDCDNSTQVNDGDGSGGDDDDDNDDDDDDNDDNYNCTDNLMVTTTTTTTITTTTTTTMTVIAPDNFMMMMTTMITTSTTTMITAPVSYTHLRAHET